MSIQNFTPAESDAFCRILAARKPLLTRNSSELVAEAKRHGAKLHKAESGMWSILDQTNSVLWYTWFMDEKTAAWAYLFQHGLAEF